MKRNLLFPVWFVLLLGYSCMNGTKEETGIVNLMVEYAKTPLGIDIVTPRFSWQMTTSGTERGARQTAYQLIVTDESGSEVWNSDRIQDDRSLNIKYQGEPLKPATRYSWKVNVWNGKDEALSAASWFETGLMNPNPNLTAWNGAQWIGGGDDDLALYPSYLPVFKLNYAFQLDKASATTKAGFLYGVNDSRLMDQNKNIYNIQSEKDESYIKLEIDVSGIKKDTPDDGMLHIYRVGYHPNDKKDVPFRSFPIPASIINEQNLYDSHTVYLNASFGQAQIYIDGTESEHLVAQMMLNPVGGSSDYIAFPQLAEIGFYVSPGQSVLFSKVEIRHYRTPSALLFAETPGTIQGGANGALKLIHPQRNAMPMLRTTFQTKPLKVKKARLYVTARGIYEIYMNGKRVGDDYFNPGLTQYPKTHLYQTYDVTEHIRKGDNAIGAWLGEGWWSGGATYTGTFWNFFGDRQSLLAQLVVTYNDGAQDIIVTNPEKWKYYNDGPIVYGSFFQGEVYNASKDAAIEGWTKAGYDDSQWKQAQSVGLTGHIALELPAGMPPVHDYSEMQLTGQVDEPPGKINELTAIAVEEVRPGVFIYDMGQNMVGVPSISLSGIAPGSQITLRYAEVKYPDLPAYQANTGMIMLENIRGALAQDIYFAKGGKETIQPRFTFHGYRFIEITGIKEPLPLKAVKGEVISSIRKLASAYETSNQKVNKLWENITWSTYANFLSIPTDCPQRNERMGWSGDISVYSRTATYMANLPHFLRRHLLAMRNTQRESGRFADVAPLGGGFGGVLWGSAGITVAWEAFLQYGDLEMLTEHYDAMTQYIAYLMTYIDPQTQILTEGNLGDWLGPEQGKNDNSLLWEAYFIYDLDLMARMAAVLGKEDDAEAYSTIRDRRKTFFNQTYLEPSTCKTIHSGFKQSQNSPAKAGDLIDTQTSYVLPLAFQICTEENKEMFLNNLMATIERENRLDGRRTSPSYSLMTGFIGTAWINRVLSENGASAAAYRLLQQTTYPSWLYSVEQGATTIWERLNSYTHTDGFGGNNSMNSFNHYSFGAVGSWMYNYSLGIERDTNEPGFKHFILQPEPDPTGEMTFAAGHYDSMYGRIKSRWEIKDGGCHYHFSIPANTTATLYLQASSLDNIRESGEPIEAAPGVHYAGQKIGKFVFELQSGEYTFTVTGS